MLQTSSNPDGKHYKCQDCNYNTSKKQCLYNHKSYYHGGRTFSCPSCNYKTTLKRNLNVHMEGIHNDLKH